jgi:hypothetical protein
MTAIRPSSALSLAFIFAAAAVVIAVATPILATAAQVIA